MIWFTSDLHLGHAGVIRYCARPWDNVADMDEGLIRKWNFRVQPTDTVYVLGDLIFTNPQLGKPLLKRLIGNKVLIRGNHDHWSFAQYEDCGFRVYEEAVIRLAGNRVRMSHFPQEPDRVMTELPAHRKFEDRRPKINEGEFLLCGHVHAAWKTQGRTLNVGVDQWNYGPISQSIVESWMAKT